MTKPKCDHTLHTRTMEWHCVREYHLDDLHYMVRTLPVPPRLTWWQRFTKRLHNRRPGHLAMRLPGGIYECCTCRRKWLTR